MFNNIVKSLGKAVDGPGLRRIVTPLQVPTQNEPTAGSRQVCNVCATAATLKVEQVIGNRVLESAYYCKSCLYAK